jgi:hypothetical protein
MVTGSSGHFLVSGQDVYSTHKQWQVANYNERGTCSTRPGDRVIQHCKWQTMQCYVTYSLRYCTYIIEADHAHSYITLQPVLQVYT